MKINHVKCYQKDYPRPQFVRKEWTNLNGQWDFCMDFENCGEVKGFFRTFPADKKINVPFVYNTQLSGIDIKDRCDNVWYRKTVHFDTKQIAKKRVILNFEGCDYIAKVWINSEFCGSHVGGYSRFSFDITNHIKKGVAEIVVKAEDSYSTVQMRGKQRWVDNNFGCWYHDTTGIWKTVWLETVSESRINSVRVDGDRDNLVAKFEADVTGNIDNLELETIISFRDNKVSTVKIKPTFNHFDYSVTYKALVPEFKTDDWRIGNAKLYDVEYVLYENGKEVDRVGSYFGPRKIVTTNDTICLNQDQVYLRMTLDQGYWRQSGLTPPDEKAIETDVLLTLKMGFNGIRKHQKIEDERFYYYCDVLGIAVWLEAPSHYEFDYRAVSNVTKEWLDILDQHYNHPSIIALVPFNESWGIYNVKRDFRQQKFTEAMYHLSKAFDGTRLVVSNDGWDQTHTDLVTLHNYEQNGEKLKNCYADMDKTMSNYRTANPNFRYPMADGYNYSNQPILLTEFGGIGYSDNHDKGWGYGDFANNEEEFFNRLEGQIKAIYQTSRFCGFCITQTTDVQQEINGLLDEDRNCKVDIDRLRKIILNR